MFGTEITHVTHDLDTTFKVKRSKVNLQGAGHNVAASELSMGWVDPRVGLGWVGNGSKICVSSGLGWVMCLK